MATLLRPVAAVLIAAVAVACGKSEQATGSTTLIIEPNLTDQTAVDLDTVLQTATQVIERRAEAFGFDGTKVERDDNRLVVHLPDVGRDDAAKLAETGLLEFRELQRDEYTNVAVVRDGNTVFVPLPPSDGSPTIVIVPTPAPTPDSEYQQVLEDAVWVPATAIGADGIEEPLTGHYLVEAHLGAGGTGMPIVYFTFNDEGARLMEQISERLIGQPLAFFFDGEPLRTLGGKIEAPVIKVVISDRAQITGLKLEEAEYVVKMLQSGPLPVPFAVVSYASPPE